MITCHLRANFAHCAIIERELPATAGRPVRQAHLDLYVALDRDRVGTASLGGYRAMKVLAADGHILCCGLVRTLQLLREDVCVTAADSIDEMLILIPGLPDLGLVLLDASMRGMENFAGLRRLVKKLPDIPVVVTSPIDNRTQIIDAIRSGARGYFSTSTKACVIRHALPLILLGETYIPACALRLDHGNGILAPRIGDAGGELTPRQCEIVTMLGEGKSNKEIAREAKVLEGTIKLHVRGIMRKLGARNRTEVVIVAARSGYLSNGALGTEAPVSKRTTANAGHKLKTILTLCVGLSSFEHCVKPAPERDHIKWGIMTTDGVLVCKKAPSTTLQRSAIPSLVQLGQREGLDHKVAVVGDQLERKSGLLT
jgi:two-component system, NarL family, nitrate/nitrite response regulator NarL